MENAQAMLNLAIRIPIGTIQVLSCIWAKVTKIQAIPQAIKLVAKLHLIEILLATYAEKALPEDSDRELTI